MKPVSRRDMLKAGLLVPAAAAAHGLGPIGEAAIQAAQNEPASLPVGRVSDSAKPGAGRERISWRRRAAAGFGSVGTAPAVRRVHRRCARGRPSGKYRFQRRDAGGCRLLPGHQPPGAEGELGRRLSAPGHEAPLPGRQRAWSSHAERLSLLCWPRGLGFSCAKCGRFCVWRAMATDAARHRRPSRL